MKKSTKPTQHDLLLHITQQLDYICQHLYDFQYRNHAAKAMINYLLSVSSRLNEWEAAFVDDIHDRLSNNRTMTYKQENKLREIYRSFQAN